MPAKISRAPCSGERDPGPPRRAYRRALASVRAVLRSAVVAESPHGGGRATCALSQRAFNPCCARERTSEASRRFRLAVPSARALPSAPLEGDLRRDTLVSSHPLRSLAPTGGHDERDGQPRRNLRHPAVRDPTTPALLRTRDSGELTKLREERIESCQILRPGILEIEASEPFIYNPVARVQRFHERRRDDDQTKERHLRATMPPELMLEQVNDSRGRKIGLEHFRQTSRLMRIDGVPEYQQRNSALRATEHDPRRRQRMRLDRPSKPMSNVLRVAVLPTHDIEPTKRR